MNRSKRAGTKFETEVVRYLADHGFPYAERRALRGTRDCGDIAGIPGVVLECKATKELDLAGALDEAEVERVNAGAELGVAVVKRRRKATAGAYVVMSLAAFCDLVAEPANAKSAGVSA